MKTKKWIALGMALLVLTGATEFAAAEEKTAKIGILQYVEHSALDSATKGFKDCLIENGYPESCFELQNPSADNATLQLMAGQFAQGDYDLLLGVATPAVQALAAVISDKPILGTAVTDYVGAGIVASNDAPSINVSGTSDMNPIEDQLALLVKLAPSAKSIGILYTSSEDNSLLQANLAKELAEKMGLSVTVKTISAVGDLQQACEAIVGGIDALYIPTDNVIASAMEIVSSVCEPAKIPVICGESNMVMAGGTATYGLDYYNLGYQTGEMAIRILEQGAQPASMPIEYLSNAVLSLNMDNIAAIGLELPEDVKAEYEAQK